MSNSVEVLQSLGSDRRIWFKIRCVYSKPIFVSVFYLHAESGAVEDGLWVEEVDSMEAHIRMMKNNANNLGAGLLLIRDANAQPSELGGVLIEVLLGTVGRQRFCKHLTFACRIQLFMVRPHPV